MKEKNIADLLRDLKEIPSDGCWERIEQQLPAISPETSSTEKGSEQVASNQSGNLILQKTTAFWAKAALITVATVTAVTITIVSLVKSDNSPTLTESIPVFIDTITEKESDIIVENIIAEEIGSGTHVETTPELVSTSDFTTQPEENRADDLRVISTVARTSTAPIFHQESQNSIPSQQSTATKNETTPTSSNSTAKTEVANNNTQNGKFTSIENDPVTQQYQEESATQTLAPISIEIPNIITPNNDGYNDNFVIVGIENIKDNRLTIWNRNRTVVFSTTSYQNDWGSDVENGLYYYLFEYTINNIQEIRKGTITVMR